METMKTIMEWNGAVNSFVWGAPVLILLVGTGVISFGAGAEGFLAKQRPAFIVDAILCVIVAVALAMLSTGRITVPDKIARSKVTWAVVAVPACGYKRLAAEPQSGI